MSLNLQYRSLAESETLEFSVKCHYPLRWNQHQEWTLHLTGCKATAHLIYSHKEFFQGAYTICHFFHHIVLYPTVFYFHHYFRSC